MATGDAPNTSGGANRSQNGRNLSENNRDSRGDQNHEANAPERRMGQTTGGTAPPGDHELPAELFGQHTRQADGKPFSPPKGGGDDRTSWGAASDRSSHTQAQGSTLADTAAAAKDYVKDAAGAAKDYVKEKAGAAKEFVAEKAGSNTQNNKGAASHLKGTGVDTIHQKDNLERNKIEPTEKNEADAANERLKRQEQEGHGPNKVTGSPYTEPGSSKSKGPPGGAKRQ